eukprot:767342-Hanusia_phi.AAC.1
MASNRLLLVWQEYGCSGGLRATRREGEAGSAGKETRWVTNEGQWGRRRKSWIVQGTEIIYEGSATYCQNQAGP